MSGDIIDAMAAWPHCPDCGVVLRGWHGGWRCSECGYTEDAEHVTKPDDGDVPGIQGG